MLKNENITNLNLDKEHKYKIFVTLMTLLQYK